MTDEGNAEQKQKAGRTADGQRAGEQAEQCFDGLAGDPIAGHAENFDQFLTFEFFKKNFFYHDPTVNSISNRMVIEMNGKVYLKQKNFLNFEFSRQKLLLLRRIFRHFRLQNGQRKQRGAQHVRALRKRLTQRALRRNADMVGGVL